MTSLQRVGGRLGAALLLWVLPCLPAPGGELPATPSVPVVPAPLVGTATRDLAPGVQLLTQRRLTASGPLELWMLDVDPKVPGVRLAPVVARGASGFGLEPVSRMAQRTGAIAAVNGGYFGRGGQPLGLIVKDGELLTGPVYGRTAIAFGRADRPPVMDRAAVCAWLDLPGGQSLEVDGFNQPRWDDQVVVYSDRFGLVTRTEPRDGSVEAAVDASGHVVQIGPCGMAIPQGGFVVSAAGGIGDWLSDTLRVGAQVSVRSPQAAYWEGFPHVVGAGPRLVEAGTVKVTAGPERFQPDVAMGRAPRSAVGVTRDGHVLLVAVDGRDASRSVGATLTELAGLMQELGAVEAMNLDGGGSTTFVAEGAVLNQPTDGYERPVSNAIAVWAAPMVGSR